MEKGAKLKEDHERKMIDYTDEKSEFVNSIFYLRTSRNQDQRTSIAVYANLTILTIYKYHIKLFSIFKVNGIEAR